MASNISSIQEAILAHLDTEFVQPVIEQSVPDTNTVLRNAGGAIEPYIAVQFGDLQQGSTYSFAGPRADDYLLPIYFQCIAPTPKIARQLQNKLMDEMLGEGFPWAGSVRKRPGGGMFAVTGSNAATEAYMFPSSFSLVVQFE